VPFALVGLLNVSLALEPTTARKDSLQQRLRRIDFAGALTIVGAVSALLVGLDQGSDGSWDSPTTAGCLFGALLLFVAFLFVETRVASEPFAPARVLFQRSIFACLSSNFCAYAFWLAALYYMPLYWQAVEMASATQASVRLLPGFVAGVAGSLLAGAVSIGHRPRTNHSLTSMPGHAEDGKILLAYCHLNSSNDTRRGAIGALHRPAHLLSGRRPGRLHDLRVHIEHWEHEHARSSE